MGAATLNDINGDGQMRVFMAGALKDSRGHFTPASVEDTGKLFDAMRSGDHATYEGPVQGLDGKSRRMRVQVLMTHMNVGTRAPITLEGSGSPEPLDSAE